MKRIVALIVVMFFVPVSFAVEAESTVATETEEVLPEPALARSGSDSFTPFMNYATDPTSDQKSLGSYETSLATGAATYNYPISLPQGRNGVQPEVVLFYNNQSSSADSISGYGWSLFTGGSITRTKEYGTENIYNTNEFDLNMSGVGGKLLPVSLIDTEHGEYGLEIEEVFYKYEFSADGDWVVTDKNGTEYYFGQDADSRQDNFAWMIDEIRDVNGNYVRYEYYKEDGQIYPKAIYYTGYGEASSANDGPMEMRFQPFYDGVTSADERADWTKWYDKGFEVKTEYLLDGIEVFVDGSLTREYELNYTTGDNGTRAMLESIVETGTSVETSFAYSNTGGAYDFSYSGIYAGFLESANFIDVNGDGYADESLFDSGGSYKYGYSILNGSDGVSFWGADFDAYYSDGGMDVTLGETASLVDMNGDLLPEIIGLFDSPYVGDGCLYKNYSEGFLGHYSDFCSPLSKNREAESYRFGDANGDGLVDLFTGDEVGWSSAGGSIYLNNGEYEFEDSGFDSPVVFAWGYDSYPSYHSGQDSGARLVDINGDGLVDIVQGYLDANYDFYTTDDEASVLKYYLNTGDGNFVEDSDYDLAGGSGLGLVFAIMEYDAYSYANGSYGGYSNQYCYDDFNGDGIADLIRDGEAYIWDGVDSLVRAGVSAFAPDCGGLIYGGTDYANANVDLNGDGLLDFFVSNEDNLAGPRGAYFRNGTKPDLLTAISTSGGAVVDITYKSALQYENPDLPIAIYTVSEVSTDDGLGNISVVDYEYSDGYYYKYFDGLTGEFSGFGEVSVSDSASETVYYFDVGCSGGATCAMGMTDGMLIGVDGEATAYADMGTTYVVDGDYLRELTVSPISAGFCSDTNCFGAYFVYGDSDFATHFLEGEDWDSTSDSYMHDVDYLSQSLKGKMTMMEVYDSGGALYQRVVNTWSSVEIGDGRYYPHVDEVVTSTFDGEISARESVVSYEYDEDYGLVVAETREGEVCIENSYFYDESIWVFKPTSIYVSDCDGDYLSKNENYYDDSGLLAEVRQWLDTDDSWIASAYEYDSYGNVISQTDPRGYETTIVYDGWNFYPEIITNALGQSMSFEMNYMNGKPSEAIDYNGYVYEYLYDGVGRLLSSSGPDLDGLGVVEYVSYEYDDLSMPRSVREIKNDGTSDGFNTYIYLDGLGRKIQVRSCAEGDYVISDFSYDERGNLEMESLPYFESDGSGAAIEYFYDVVGRVLSVTNEMGASSTDYSPWTETVTDPMGNVKIYYRDVYGNLVQVDDGFSTYYEYDLLGRMVGITDALGNIRNFEWDSLGRKISQEEGGGVWEYEYDENGNLLVENMPSGETIIYVYDALNRVESETVSDGATSIYVYDSAPNGVGLVASITDGSGSASYEYDALGGIVLESRVLDGEIYETGFVNDLMGRQVSITYPSGSEVEYSFNDSGAVESVTMDGEVLISDMDYSPMGQWEDVSYANGDNITNTYDPDQMYLLTNKNTVSATGTVLQDLTYNYDPAGNVLSILDDSDMETANDTYYEYDDLYRLVSVVAYAESGGVLYDHSYSYDAVGNLTYMSEVGVVSYEETGNAGPYGATSAGSYIYDYDENGNVVSDGAYNYFYNAKGEMISSEVVGGGTVYNYGYDFYGNRVVKSSDDGAVTYYPNQFYEEDSGMVREYVFVDGVRVYELDTEITEPFDYEIGTEYIGCLGKVIGAGSCWNYIAFDTVFDAGAVVTVFAQVQSARGSGDADVDIKDVTASGFYLKLEEDRGKSKTWQDGAHVSEYVGWVAFDMNELPSGVLGGTENFGQGLRGKTSEAVVFDTAFPAGSEPVIFAQKQSENAGDTVRANIISSSESGFTVELREDQGSGVAGGWDILHAKEDVSWIAFLPEDMPFAGVAGSANIGGSWTTVSLDPSFVSAPIVFASIVAQKESDVAVSDVKSVGVGGFSGRVDELIAAGWNDRHVSEKWRYFAVGEISGLLGGGGAGDDGGQGYFFHQDHLGGSSVVTDTDGDMVAAYDYYPYGSSRAVVDYSGGEFANDYKFTGQEEDAESGLYYYGARYYSPVIGRFMSRDPALGDGRVFDALADPQSLNPYAYARNNPVKYVDPSGEYNVKTGTIEEDDTKDGIVDAVNEALGIDTDWDTIAEVSFFDANKSIKELVNMGEFTACGTDYVTDVTNELNELNEERAESASGYNKFVLAVLFQSGGAWDLKNSWDPIFGEKNGYRKYWSYIYDGNLIRYDAPGNINFGYVWRSAGHSLNSALWGGNLEQRGGGDDFYDQKMMIDGYVRYYYDNK